MSSRLQSPLHPPPLIIPPLSTLHTHTLILLHGRGSTGPKFSSPLLAHPIPFASDSAPLTLQHHLPTTKFIFPTSPFRRASFANRARITQWFDNWSVEPDKLEERPEVQVPGLRESVRYVHELIEEEAEKLGGTPGNVVVMGLSLGACVALTAALCWGGEPVGAVVGMAGRVPLRGGLEEMLSDNSQTEENDEGVVSFDHDDHTNPHTHSSPASLAIHFLTQELDLPSPSTTPTTTTHPQPPLTPPIFLGHGTHDEKVPISIGRTSAEFLKHRVGCDVTWREYPGLGHWYCGEELRDVVGFLKGKCIGI